MPTEITPEPALNRTNDSLSGPRPESDADSPRMVKQRTKAAIYEIGHKLQNLAKGEEPRAIALPPPKDDYGIPLRYRNAMLTESKETSAIRVVREYLLAPKGRCLLMIGGTGIGKTYAAIVGLNAWPKNSKRFFPFPSLCGELLGELRVDTLRRAKEVGFAVFDDVGMEYKKDGGLIQAFIDEIVWHREANLKPTIITTNLSWKEIEDRYSPRIVSRLGGSWVMRRLVGGESLR